VYTRDDERDLTLTGFITFSDPPLEETPKGGVETISPDDDLEETGQLMLESKYGCLPVTEGTRLVGILTEADFVRYLVDQESRRREGERFASAGYPMTLPSRILGSNPSTPSKEVERVPFGSQRWHMQENHAASWKSFVFRSPVAAASSDT
jgi:hypothetical protein